MFLARMHKDTENLKILAVLSSAGFCTPFLNDRNAFQAVCTLLLSVEAGNARCTHFTCFNFYRFLYRGLQIVRKLLT